MGVNGTLLVVVFRIVVIITIVAVPKELRSTVSRDVKMWLSRHKKFGKLI